LTNVYHTEPAARSQWVVHWDHIDTLRKYLEDRYAMATGKGLGSLKRPHLWVERPTAAFIERNVMADIPDIYIYIYIVNLVISLL